MKIDYDKMKKTLYEAPETLIMQVKVSGRILQSSVECMTTVAGSWANEEDW